MMRWAETAHVPLPDAVAQRHVYPLHLATPAMPTPESSIPSTPAKKEEGRGGRGRNDIQPPTGAELET